MFESPGYLELRPELTQMFVFARRNNVNASYSHRKTRVKYNKNNNHAHIYGKETRYKMHHRKKKVYIEGKTIVVCI